MVFGRKLTEKNWLGEHFCLAAMLAAVSFTMGEKSKVEKKKEKNEKALAKTKRGGNDMINSSWRKSQSIMEEMSNAHSIS